MSTFSSQSMATTTGESDYVVSFALARYQPYVSGFPLEQII